MRLTAVVMAFNEAATLQGVCSELLSAGADELLIVDDGSEDDTGAVAAALAGSDPRVRVIAHSRNLGLGMVYRTGFENASGDLLTFFPADGQFPAVIIADFRAAIADSDLVLGYLSQHGRGALGALLSYAERKLQWVLFGPLPRFQGIFMVRVNRLRSLQLSSTGRGWTIVLEMLVRAHRAGWRIASRPTEIRPRRAGRSKVNNWATVRSHLVQLIELRRTLRLNP